MLNSSYSVVCLIFLQLLFVSDFVLIKRQNVIKSNITKFNNVTNKF